MDSFFIAYDAGYYDRDMVVSAIVVAILGALWFSYRAAPRRRFYKSLRKAMESLDSRGPYNGQAQWDIYEAMDRWEEWQRRKIPPYVYSRYVHSGAEVEVDVVKLERELPPSRPRHVM